MSRIADWLTRAEDQTPVTVVGPNSYAAHWNQRTGAVIVLEGIECGGDLIFAAPGDAIAVDVALAERSFRRATEWIDLDDTSQIRRSDVYRHPCPDQCRTANTDGGPG